jgi:hypothetical protein
MSADLSHTLTALLRSPASIAASITEGRDLRSIARASLLALLVGTLVFGGVVGSHRGSLQMLYAALKLPWVSMLTLALSVPVLHGARAAFERPQPFAQSAALMLAASARTALVLLALAPALALALQVLRGYHAAVVLSALSYGLAGLAGVGLLRRGLGPAEGRLALLGFVLSAHLLTSAQVAWGLRPWLVRPSADVVLVRPPEGTFAEELARAGLSAAGIYDSTRSKAREAERRAHGEPR